MYLYNLEKKTTRKIFKEPVRPYWIRYSDEKIVVEEVGTIYLYELGSGKKTVT